ncbi:SixA phosphatase family protein [Stratiformator vulcanicus]|uniref:Phosphohistidine phosphatase n=1 Tax=Stratiformator vulcanicus TaxID=2527980 RepID=A0A517QX88_9PLAN|nr:histidine phosphatase family protein [Stratiformator vulcanicus]QDT36251.1 phosphohistidine phosphatase [Stratiformator vulcanicus]
MSDDTADLEWLIMRHAKASRDDETLSDFDRPLKDRGRREAPLMARQLAQAGLLPDLVLSSTSKRTRETTELFLNTLREVEDHEPEVRYLEDLYLADWTTHVNTIAAEGGVARRVLLIAHNPGLENLVTVLTGQACHLPTAAIAHVTLPVAAWAEFQRGEEVAGDNVVGVGQLEQLWTPKDLR